MSDVLGDLADLDLPETVLAALKRLRLQDPGLFRDTVRVLREYQACQKPSGSEPGSTQKRREQLETV